jgi:archaellum biogenesis ATPase FlaH
MVKISDMTIKEFIEMFVKVQIEILNHLLKGDIFFYLGQENHLFFFGFFLVLMGLIIRY